ncbi:hypothetical protein [Gloeobacter kilaueensis]|nr:hypothetical protein [Gloeobacter kilaueensis]
MVYIKQYKNSVQDEEEIDKEAFLLSADEILQDTIGSDKKVAVWLNYETIAKTYYGLNATHCGRWFRSGFEFLDRGRVFASSISITDLVEARKNAIEPYILQELEVPLDVDEEASFMLDEAFFEFFLRASGLTEKEEPLFKHAAFFPEGTWPVITEGNLVYHKDINQFSADFARLYADYYWGIYLYPALEEDMDIWNLTAEQKERLTNNHGRKPESIKDRYKRVRKYLSSRAHEIEDFMESISEDQMRELSQMPGSQMVDLLKQAVKEYPYIQSFDFGKRGMMFSGGPLYTLWPIYHRAAQIALGK